MIGKSELKKEKNVDPLSEKITIYVGKKISMFCTKVMVDILHLSSFQ
jgi:hypothetical protein